MPRPAAPLPLEVAIGGEEPRQCQGGARAIGLVLLALGCAPVACGGRVLGDDPPLAAGGTGNGSAAVGGLAAQGGQTAVGGASGGVQIVFPPPAGASADGPDSGCNRLDDEVPMSDWLYTTKVNADPPTPIGGAIADGTYDLTELRIFAGAETTEGWMGRLQWYARIVTPPTGDSAELQYVWLDFTGEMGLVEEVNESLTFAGFDVTASKLCAIQGVASGSRSGHYSATSDRLELIFPDAGSRTTVWTFVRQ